MEMNCIKLMINSIKNNSKRKKNKTFYYIFKM